DPVDAIQELDGRRDITVTGAVDSVLPYYRGARVVCAPIRIGGGTRLKVVESWSVGRPLVATRTAVDGLDAVDGDNCLLADTPADFAAAVCTALRPDLGIGLRQGALRSAGPYAWER